MNGKASEPPKDRYMVREEEMRQRYHEYKPQHLEPMVSRLRVLRAINGYLNISIFGHC